MLFETARFLTEDASPDDAAAIADVYASNHSFVQAHLQGRAVTEAWILQEQAQMKQAKFISAKLVEKDSGKIVGVLDFCVKKEAYLSLLMFHKDVQGSGAGAEVFRGFETYACTKGAQSIRLEVVLDDPQTAFPFWKKQGFVPVEEVTLHWGDVTLKALQMVKK